METKGRFLKFKGDWAAFFLLMSTGTFQTFYLKDLGGPSYYVADSLFG